MLMFPETFSSGYISIILLKQIYKAAGYVSEDAKNYEPQNLQRPCGTNTTTSSHFYFSMKAQKSVT